MTPSNRIGLHKAFFLLPVLFVLLARPVFSADGPGQAPEPKFDIFEIAVEGNTRLSDLEIERAVTPYLGEQKATSDVHAARAALESRYHAAGYLTVVVSIPDQDVGSGVVKLSVVEGSIDRLRVKGAEYHLASGIKAGLPEFSPGNVPYFPQVQRELSSLNRSPDLRATPVLKPGRMPGTVDVQMEVEDDLPLHGSVEYSNRQSANTTPQRLSATARYDNLWQRGHSASLTLQTSPQKTDEVRTAAATYVMPSGDRGNALVLYSVISRSKLATLSGSPGLGLLGDSNIFGIRYAVPLPSTPEFSHALSVGLDYKDIKQSVVVAGSSELPSPVSYAPLAATYNASWMQDASTTSLQATATAGMRGLLGSRDEEFAAKRSGASGSFFSLRTGLQYTQRVDRWELSGKLETQLASGPLVSNEQFAAGGAESVRAYLEGERVGDMAVRWALEARTPKFAFAGKESPWRLVGLAFYEGVKLKVLQPVYPQTDHLLVRGAGLGLRLTGYQGISFDLDWARALDDADITRAGDHRLHSRLLWDF